MPISRKVSLAIGVIVVVVLVSSVSYYELTKPPVHYGFISMSKASSILNANYTSQTNLSTVQPVQNPFPGSNSFIAYKYNSQNTQQNMVIAEGHFNNTTSATEWYEVHVKVIPVQNSVKVNQSYDGFTVTYMDANLTSTHMYEAILVLAVNGNFVMEMYDPGGVVVTSSAEIPNLVHAQLNAMA